MYRSKQSGDGGEKRTVAHLFTCNSPSDADSLPLLMHHQAGKGLLKNEYEESIKVDDALKLAAKVR